MTSGTARNLDDLAPERPDRKLADALPAPGCRCDRAMPMVDQNGETRCANCGRQIGRAT